MSIRGINENILEFVKTLPKVTLGFSAGHDSVTCAKLLQDANIEFTPFYFYHIPGLDFVNETIEMYEDYFNFKVIRLPHPMLLDYLRHQDFQPPKMIDYLAEFDIPKLSFRKVMKLYFDSIGEENIYYDINGMRGAESFNRRMTFKQHGYINHNKKKISLIGDWKVKDVRDFFEENKIPVSKDYQIWNRSFDGLKYQFLFGVKENYPNDYEKIKELFPLIDLELKRYEFNRRYFSN